MKNSIVLNLFLPHPDVKHDRLHLVLAIEDEVHHARVLNELITVEHFLILPHDDRSRAVLDDLKTVDEIENKLLVVFGRSQSTKLLRISTHLILSCLTVEVQFDHMQPEVEKL